MLKSMIKLSVAIILCAMFFVGGCASLTSNKQENMQKYSHVMEINQRLLTEDIEMTLMLDRPTSLTRWHIPY